VTELALVHARDAIAHGSKSFALASRLLPRRARDQAAIVYAWCRRADDAIDLAPPEAQPAAVARLDDELARIYAGAPLGEPVLDGFAAVVRARAIPRLYPAELLAGMAMDADGTRYATLADLERYCWRVAATVGLMMSHVLGVSRDDALVEAADLGVAMQLTNVCRDVVEDWERGRLYVPDELLAAHGAGGLAGALGGPLPASAVRPLAGAVAELLALADQRYRRGERGLAALPLRGAIAVRAARRIYAAIGARLAARGHDVTAGRAVVSRGRKLWHLSAAVAGELARAPRRALAWLRGARPRLPALTLEPGQSERVRAPATSVQADPAFLAGSADRPGRPPERAGAP
jgi:phytoene synthase